MRILSGCLPAVQDWAKEEWKMTNEEIKSAIAVELAKIAEAKKAIGRAGLDIERIQYDCPHTNKKRWTNNWELPPAVVYSFMAPPVKKGDCQFCLHSHKRYDNPCWERFFDKDKPCWEPKKRISKDTVVFVLVAIVVIAIVWQMSDQR